ncbi:MAG: hypothetical protein RLZZ292_525 [Bacteroidota bacterium]|jgi:hypothetical protein
MKYCPECGVVLLQNAKFCHECGEKIPATVASKATHVTDDPRPSASEKTEKPKQAPKVPPKQAEPLHWEIPSSLEHDALVEGIKANFFKALRERVTEQHREEQYADYVEIFYQSRFNDALLSRASLLVDDIRQLQKRGINPSVETQQLLTKTYDGLLDYFIVNYCQGINDFPIPASILKYENATWASVNLRTMILDYLDFEHEKETVYTDFVVMPLQKLKNASTSFLTPEKNEKIFLICDQTVFGSCKEGFALTEKGLYWKAHLESPHHILYKDLASISRKQEWIIVNDLFFNCNKSLNIKLLKLLKKIKNL